MNLILLNADVSLWFYTVFHGTLWVLWEIGIPSHMSVTTDIWYENQHNKSREVYSNAVHLFSKCVL
jgi:hypothetical protein